MGIGGAGTRTVTAEGASRCGPGRLTRYRRPTALVLALTAALALTGCVPVVGPVTRDRDPDLPHRDERGVTQSLPEPTARSYDGDVEVWDLTSPPTAEGFGIDLSDTLPVAAYSSTASGARPARFLLPTGPVELDVTEVVFELRDLDEPLVAGEEVLQEAGRTISLSVRATGGAGADEGVTSWRRLLRDLRLPDDTAAELEDLTVDPGPVDPLDSRPDVGVGVEAPRPEGAGLTVGAGTTFDPRDEDRRFRTSLTVIWDAVPVP